MTAVSRAAVAGDTILVYVQGDDGYLALVAYDAPTGRERWRRRATTSQQRPELPLGVAVTDAGLVGYLEPGRGGTGTVVLLDPRGAGTVVAQTPTTYPVVSVPSVCAAHAEVICVGVRGQGWQRLGAGQGDLQGFAGLDTGYVERISSNGLVRTMRDGEVRIAALDATHVLWDKSESEVLGTGYSTLGCVGFTYHEATDQFVGTVCRYDGKRPADGTPWAGFTRAVAFARADGRPTWHLDGGDQSCDAPFTRKGADATDPLVLCVWTAGTLRIGADQSDILDPAVELTRVDPASGTSMWRTAAGKVRLDSLAPLPVAVCADASLVVPSVAGGLRVSAADGTSRPVGPTDQAGATGGSSTAPRARWRRSTSRGPAPHPGRRSRCRSPRESASTRARSPW